MQEGYEYAATTEQAANALPMVDMVLAVQDPVDVCYPRAVVEGGC